MPGTSPAPSAERRARALTWGFLTLAVASVAVAFLVGPKRGRVHLVAIENMAYVPQSIEARVGDRVEFTNRDMMPHTVTGAGFDSGAIAAGKSWTIAVERPGDLAYRCAYHPMMTGSIAVIPVVQD